MKEELAGVRLGDRRLERRAVHLLEALANKPDSSINSSFSGWAETKGAYRFFDHAKVRPDKILHPHYEATHKRSQDFEVLLHIQDTTQFDYTHRKEEVSGLGKLRKEEEHGFFLHPTLAVTGDGVCLGVVAHKVFVRQALLGKAQRQTSKPIEAKESKRWLESYAVTQEMASRHPEKTYINITDREGDFYELFEQYDGTRVGNAHLLVRAKGPARLIKDAQEGYAKLWDKVGAQPVQGTLTFPLSAIGPKGPKERMARQVTQEVRFCKVEIGAPPKVRQHKALRHSVHIYAVLCRESAPYAVDKPITWMLLTTMEVTTQEQAVALVRFYIHRWQIELYFKVLKSGCRIQGLQLKSLERLRNCLAFYMIIAWRILLLTKMARTCPEVRCDLFYAQEEWRVAWQVHYRKPPPEKPPSLLTMHLIVAGFAGFLNRKNDPPPGVKTMWQGLEKLKHFVIAYNAFSNIKTYG